MNGLVEGRIVHYVLTEEDANQINITRLASQLAREKVQTENKVILHTGNTVMAYEHFPAIIVRVFHNEYGQGEHGVNLQVFLDGNDSHWVCSRRFAEPADLKAGTWHWVEPA